MSVPPPIWLTIPVPEMLFATVIVSLRLKASVALSTTLAVPSVPEVPPLPICSVPDEMVVVPV